MQEWEMIQASGERSLVGTVRKCAMRMERGFYSSAVSTTFESPTHGFHTRESTSSRGNVGADNSGLSSTTSWWEKKLGSR